MAWWGIKLRIVTLVEGEGAVGVHDGVFVIEADDWEHAFRRALEVGEGEEEEYVNADGVRVRRRLSEVLRIHGVMADSVEGEEVMYESGSASATLSFDATFTPANSRPEAT